MSQQLIQAFAAKFNPANRFGDLEVGMTVRIHQKLAEAVKGKGGKSQTFEGIIISHKHGNEAGATITVRRSIGGYGVEKVYPLRLPSIEKIDVVKTGNVRRAKLYYLREKSAKEIRKKTRAELVALQKQITAEAAPIAEPTPLE
jgi:large subunit ribosomal protein L19